MSERTIGFLEGWRALRPPEPPPLAERVRRLLEGAGPLLRAPAPEVMPPHALPSPEAMMRLLKGLRAPLTRARTSGSLIDIWSVAGLRRRELPNAAVLAWLIDPRGSHGQGSLCLTGLLDLVHRKSGMDLRGLTLGDARVQPEERPLGSDRDRVDIVVEAPDLLIFIEVKIDAGEGHAQLSRYAESAARVADIQALSESGIRKKTLTVFLSPRPPAETVPGVVHVSWRELASTLTCLAGQAGGFTELLIRSFAAHMRTFG